MGEWTGKWKSSGHIKCQCQCGTPNGAETWDSTFDADDLQAMKHDGETESYIRYLCPLCIKKYGAQPIQIRES